MKNKLSVYLLLILFLLATTGCTTGDQGLEAMASAAVVPNNSHKADDTVSELKTEISKEIVVENAIYDFKAYFDLDFDRQLIADKTEFNKWNEYWLTYWEDGENYYYANSTQNNERVGIGFGKIEDNSESVSISENAQTQEALIVAQAFIKKHFQADEDKITFIRVGSLMDLDFAYDYDKDSEKRKVIYIDVDGEDNKVRSFTLNEEKAPLQDS